MSNDDKFKEVNNEALVKHNELRGIHGVPALEIDWDLAKSAQEYAEKLARENKFGHSNSTEYGENLANSYNSAEGYVFSGTQATQNWYDEIKDYKFGQEEQENSKIGHFSQVVWKSTTHAGFGRAQTSSGSWIIVGQYKPPGNFIGQYLDNVLAPNEQSTNKEKEEEPTNEKGDNVQSNEENGKHSMNNNEKSEIEKKSSKKLFSTKFFLCCAGNR